MNKTKQYHELSNNPKKAIGGRTCKEEEGIYYVY